jgi:stage II sporulation protein AA (anti-sigma F factor antagonist)
MQQIVINQETRDNVVILTLSGQLDAVTADRLSSVTESLKQSEISYVLIDLKDVSLVDSSGIGAVVSLYKLTRSRGGDMVIANVGPQPMEVFKIINLTKAIAFYDSVEEAFEKLTS